MKNKNLIALIIVLLLTGLYFLGRHLMKPDYDDPQKNPYDLKLDSVGRIEKDKYGSYEKSTIQLNLKEAKSIAVHADNIFVSGDKKIQIADKNGKIHSEIKLDQTATALSISNTGIICAAVKDHIEIFNSTGEIIKKFKSLGEKAYITSLSVTEDKIFASEAESEFIYVFDFEGNVKDIFGDSVSAGDIMRFVLPSYYFDIDNGPDGTLWAANTGKHAIINVNNQGDLRSYWGSSSAEVDGFCGCCNPSHFSIMKNGSFITSEKGIVRVKKYDAYGKFMHVIAGPEQFKEKSTGLDIAVDNKNVIYVLEPAANCIHVFKEI